jgi:hypothetical protein
MITILTTPLHNLSITKCDNYFIDDYHFNNTTKINYKIVPNHIGENKNLQSHKNWTYFMYLK